MSPPTSTPSSSPPTTASLPNTASPPRSTTPSPSSPSFAPKPPPPPPPTHGSPRRQISAAFVSGDSAGATIAHHVAVRVGSGRVAAGCVLLWPYFGGEERTESEATCPADVFLTLSLYDQMWRLALPPAASRDHPLANPFGPESLDLGSVDLPPVLVAVGGRDMLVDRIRDYVARLNAMGNKRVELVEFEGQGHGFSVFEPDGEAAAEFVGRVLRRFVHGGAAAPAS